MLRLIQPSIQHKQTLRPFLELELSQTCACAEMRQTLRESVDGWGGGGEGVGGGGGGRCSCVAQCGGREGKV